MATKLELAEAFSRAFERRTRDNGEEFVCLRDGTAEWMRDAAQKAHGDMLPDDWRYRFIEGITDAIAERLRFDPDAELGDFGHEVCDGLVPVYNGERAAWLGSNLTRGGYCDEAREEGLVAEAAGIFERIGAGIYVELHEIFCTISEALASQAEK